MSKNRFLTTAIALGVTGLMAFGSAASFAADAPAKNWNAPAEKIYAQKLSDETMAKNPDLLSVTIHGVPPGMSDVYTMFAGSYPERIGNPDDPDDIDVSKKGITILDPRWHRTKDTVKKWVVLMPMRDKAGDNIGLVVYAFKDPKGNPNATPNEMNYLKKSAALRDALAKRITSYDALFAPAK